MKYLRTLLFIKHLWWLLLLQIIFNLGVLKNEEMDDVSYFCLMFRDQHKTAQYEGYRLWALLLMHKRTPSEKYDHVDFDEVLKDYIRSITKHYFNCFMPKRWSFLWIYLTAYYFRNISSIKKYWNFQSEAKVEQIIAIVTTRSVSCCHIQMVIITIQNWNLI